MNEHPRFSTHYEQRAYNARMAKLDERDEFIDDLRRLEGECDDAIHEAHELAEMNGDMAAVERILLLAKLLVTQRREIAETAI